MIRVELSATYKSTLNDYDEEGFVGTYEEGNKIMTKFVFFVITMVLMVFNYGENETFEHNNGYIKTIISVGGGGRGATAPPSWAEIRFNRANFVKEQ